MIFVANYKFLLLKVMFAFGLKYSLNKHTVLTLFYTVYSITKS